MTGGSSRPEGVADPLGVSGGRYAGAVEIIIGLALFIGVPVGITLAIVWWFRDQARNSQQGKAMVVATETLRAVASDTEPPADSVASFRPQNHAQRRLWERHYGLAAVRGLTPEQRDNEIARLRAADAARR